VEVNKSIYCDFRSFHERDGGLPGVGQGEAIAILVGDGYVTRKFAHENATVPNVFEAW
jgi:hypothetical protein